MKHVSDRSVLEKIFLVMFSLLVSVIGYVLAVLPYFPLSTGISVTINQLGNKDE